MALIKAPKYKEGHKPPPDTKYMYQHSHGNHTACCPSYLGKGKQGKIWKSKRVPPGILKEKPEKVEWTKSIDICKYSVMTDSWEELLILPVRLTEETANVPSVSQLVSEDAFEGKEVVLLDLKLLKIVDIKSTTGMSPEKIMLLAV